MALPDGFWDKVRKTDRCWIWEGTAPDRTGYARVRVGPVGDDGRRRRELVHRAVLADALGRPIQPGMEACHGCPVADNPLCVNPAHLREGTKADNGADKARKGSSKGDRHANCRVSDRDVEWIRSSGLRNATVAWVLGTISRDYVGAIRRGTTRIGGTT